MNASAIAHKSPRSNGHGAVAALAQLPPHSESAERALIGSVLLDPSVFPAISHVQPVYFFVERNGTIWQAIQYCAHEQIDIDYLTVVERLESQGQLADVGGSIYVGQLITDTPTAIHAESYAVTVVEKWYRRALDLLGGEIAQKARDEASNLDAFREQWLRYLSNPPQSIVRKTERVVHWAGEALQTQPPITWIVYQLFSAGSVSLLVGEGGSGKTWAMLDLAVSVANREPWLNLPTQPCTVLLIDEESGERRLARRLGDVMRAHDAPASTLIAYTCLGRFNLTTAADSLALKQMIESTGAQLVVLDALADVMLGGDENSVGDVMPVFQNLHKIADETQSAIIVLHHANKIGGYRGSSAILGAVDLMLSVEQDKDSGVITFTTTKTRDVAPFAFSAATNFGVDSFNLSPTAKPESKPHFSKSESYVLRYLESHGDSSIEDIKSNADACAPETARRALYALVDRKVVARIDSGGPGMAARYSLINGSPKPVQPVRP